MFQEISDPDVIRAANLVAADAADLRALPFVDPAIDQTRRVVVKRIEKAREHSRGRATSPGIVRERPECRGRRKTGRDK